MKLNILYGLFFVLSTLLIVVTLTDYMKDFFLPKNQKEIRVQKSKKNYLKKRDEFVPTRTLSMAQKEIDMILDKNSYLFNKNISNKGSIDSIKVTLLNLTKVLNNLEEDAILTISTYSQKKGSKVYNLELSQKYADFLKKYFRERTSLPLIVAIGYGKAIPFKKEDKRDYRQIQINLKRIK